MLIIPCVAHHIAAPQLQPESSRQFLSQHPQFHWMAGKSQNISLLINFITTEHTYMYIHY